MKTWVKNGEGDTMSTLIKRKIEQLYYFQRKKDSGQEKILIKRKRALHVIKGSLLQEDITTLNEVFTHDKHTASNCVREKLIEQ